MRLGLMFLSAIAVCSAVGLPSPKKLPRESDSIYERLRRDFRVSRQAPDFSCTTNSDCFPTDMQDVNIGQDLVSCVDGLCECNSCFMLDPDSSVCFVCIDFPYNTTTNMCGIDVRQDQRRAFFLSFFLSSTGAANFYIQSYGLAVGQLVVLIVFLMSMYVLLCPCCICCGIVDKEGAIKGTCLFIVLFILSIVFAVVMGFSIVSWWIGDLTIFANNERMSGNGCFLRPNL